MVRWDDRSNRDVLSDMWFRIFHDTRPYIAYYFDEMYGKNEVLLEEDDENIRGMLHLNPYTLQMKDDDVSAHYIVGVSTEEEFRRQGVMRHLLLETFHSLRERGEAFTYLMPADENYYLPFSFRFGMNQLEQEIEPGFSEKEEAGYTFYRSTEVNYSDFVTAENVYRRKTYDVSTKIDEAYLERVDKEVRSEFGCYFYMKKEGVPIGHFVVYAEDDFMSISQLVCYDSHLRAEYLRQVLQFCDGRYHFRSYKITYPEDWKNDLVETDQYGTTHVFKTGTNPVIMFRILCLEKMERWLSTNQPVSCILKVTDPDIPEQEGCYSFEGDEHGVKIRRIMENDAIFSGEDGRNIDVNGTVSIATLTGRLFGNMISEEEKNPDRFDEKAMNFWKSVRALSMMDIPEIV